jgi:hypothetical protein
VRPLDPRPWSEERSNQRSRYRIYIDNDATEDVTYKWPFATRIRNPNSFLAGVNQAERRQVDLSMEKSSQ